MYVYVCACVCLCVCACWSVASMEASRVFQTYVDKAVHTKFKVHECIVIEVDVVPG